MRSQDVWYINPEKRVLTPMNPGDFGDNWSTPIDKADQTLIADYFTRIKAQQNKVDFVRLAVGGVEKTMNLGGIKTRSHGPWESESLHPHFTPFVAKYSDNGRAQSKDDLDSYMAAYRKRAPMAYPLHVLERKNKRKLRQYIRSDTRVFQLMKKSYLFLKKG